MENRFNYHAEYILKGMNTIEELTGEMFQNLLPEFESNFWLAHDKKAVRELIILGQTMDKVIDDLRSGSSFVLDRMKEKGGKI